MFSSAIISFILSKVRNIEVIKWIAIVVLFVAVVALAKSCSDERNTNKEWREKERQSLRALNSGNEELKLTLEKKDAKIDSMARELAEKLEVKPRQITQYKYIEIEKKVKGDTLYELLEVSIPDGTKFPYKFDECTSVVFEWGTPAKWTLHRNLQISDVSYTKRRNLWGIKFLPRLGKKEHYQTLITNCGDTVVNNRLITFTK